LRARTCLEAELAAWTDSRGAQQATRELLAFAADGNAVTVRVTDDAARLEPLSQVTGSSSRPLA